MRIILAPLFVVSVLIMLPLVAVWFLSVVIMYPFSDLIDSYTAKRFKGWGHYLRVLRYYLGSSEEI